MIICKYSQVTNSYNEYVSLQELPVILEHHLSNFTTTPILVISKDHFDLARGELIATGVDPSKLILISSEEIFCVSLLPSKVVIFVEKEAFKYLHVRRTNLIKRPKPLDSVLPDSLGFHK
jgi:hypothetical protein